MITHRVETQPAPEPSVRFYKLIALSFLAVTVVLLGVVIFMTSKKAAITIVAKEDTKRVDLSVHVAPTVTGELTIKGSVTSTVFHWSETFRPTGNKTVVGVATGQATLYNKSGQSQPLVKTTRLLTPEGVLFRLADRVVVPSNSSVVANVYADQAGAGSEIKPSSFTIPGLSAERQKVVYAQSSAAMKGGVSAVGVLGGDDIKNAIASFGQKAKDAFLAKVSTNTAPGNQFIVAMANGTTEVNHKAGEEVTAFTVSGTSTMVLVTFRASDLNAIIDSAVGDQLNGSNEKFLTVDKKPELSVSAYDVNAGTAEIALHQDALVTLDAEADSLSPDHFFGKKKDEITRYLLGLNHVASVEVKFSPSWMPSAPTVADRIKVVVKNVE